MGLDLNYYSIEAVSDALAAAGSVAANSQDEAEIIRGHLAPLIEILQMNGGVFYATQGGPLAALSPVRVCGAGRRDLQPPPSVPASMESFIRNTAGQVVTSYDAVFSMGHLRNLPPMSAASSMWAAVGVRDAYFGVLALFDQSHRDFRKVEQQLLRTFALQLAQTLEVLQSGRPAAVEPAEVSELGRYLESGKLMGSISRDLINPLTAILGYVELLKGEKLDDRCRHYLEKLQSQTEKAQGIVMALNSAVPAPHPAALAPQAKGPEQIAAMPAELAETSMVPTSFPPPVAGRSRVLVVQRSEALLEFERAVLSGMQADVLATHTGNDAITVMEAEELNAVLIDDDLEGEWTGARLLGWIAEHRPDLRDRVLMTVCSRPRTEVQELLQTSSIPHVKKPIQMAELFSGIRRILGASAPGESKMLH